MKKIIIILFIALLLSLGVIYFLIVNKSKNQINMPTNDNKATMANPASINCKKQGGRLVIATKQDGSQYGLCYFDDNRACEEWPMLRGDCPVGGVKTTGYDTEAQKFCAWSGGSTLAVANAICIFKDGSTCLADDFYNDTCQKTSVSDGKSLDLSNQNLSALPKYVLGKNDLEILNLSNNNLTGALPAEIRQLKNLKVLNLSHNQMTGLPAELGQLSSLEILDVSYNKLTGLPYELGNLSNLKTFILTGNNYATADLQIIKDKLGSGVNIIVK